MHDTRFENINTLASKEAERAELVEAVARFKAEGGTIYKAAANEWARPANQGYGRGYKPKAKPEGSQKAAGR